MVYFFGFLGGLALFLYGMQLMGEGLQRAAGEKLQKILEKLTGVLPVAVALGAVVTGILQSSSATTVMTVGFVNAGLMRASSGKTPARQIYRPGNFGLRHFNAGHGNDERFRNAAARIPGLC